ncbi:MAG TPA: tRNA lysidine(34) synthetase TilS [Spirochaeta sp.]|nr:tRNA lysidine(34) synthetase TilS [Spirochaeta sp.]
MKSIKETIENSVRTYLENFSIKPESRVIAGWSGGPDSTVMISVLKNLSGYNLDITAVWYNHGLRSLREIEEEERLVCLQAEKLGVRLIRGASGWGVIKSTASEQSQSIEEAARNARYAFFEEIRRKQAADYIAVGHNLNDNTETMLMRFLQNAGTAGLSGIPVRRGIIIRPICGVGRADIEEYLKEESLDVSIDHTNLENDFLRNKLRLDVLPVIRESFPYVDENLSHLSKKFRLQNDFIEYESEKRLVWHEDKDRWAIRQDIFYSEHLLLRIRSVFSILNRIAPGTRIKYSAVEQAAAGEYPGNGKILLRTSVFEILTSEGYIFIQRLVNHTKKSYFIYLEPGVREEFFGQTVSASNAKNEDIEVSGAENRLLLEWNGPLILRSCREGDCIEIEGGCKSLKKLFSEWKVKPADRSRLPVIEDNGRISAVLGRHLGYNNRLACRRLTSGRKKKILLIINSDTETICE